MTRSGAVSSSDGSTSISQRFFRYLARISRTLLWLGLFAAFIVWTALAGSHHWRRACLLTALAASCFVLGAAVGFIFTTYDQESDTIGKLKDWLVGGLATITLVKFAALKPVLLTFTLHQGPDEFALALSVAITFLGIGFFFMFFGRELVFNVPLARKRDERNRIETGQAAAVTMQLLSALPTSLLVGIDDAENVLENEPAEAARLRTCLYSDDVDSFLAQSDARLRSGSPLEWDVVSKNAYLHYYRTYFAPEQEKNDEAALALDWIARALVINPRHMDLATKQADLLGTLKRYGETVQLLERLYPVLECPAFVEQWLGYYLLFLHGRQRDAIHYSQAFLARFPGSRSTRRNLACAWAREACSHAAPGACTVDHHTEAYREAIQLLRIIVVESAEDIERFRTVWISGDGHGHFHCFQNDPTFRGIVGLGSLPATVPAADPKPAPALHLQQ